MTETTFTVDRPTLKDALTIAKEAIGRRSMLPVLTGVRLSGEGGTLTLEATDLDRTVTCRIAADVTGSGAVLLDAKALAAAVKSGADTVTVRLMDDDRVGLTNGAGDLTLRPLTLADFPTLPAFPDGKQAVLTDDRMRAAARAGLCAGTDEARPVLTGVLFDDDGDACATDSRHLAADHLGAEVGEAVGGSLVPAKVVALAASLKADDYTVSANGEQYGVTATAVRGPKGNPRHIDVTVVCRTIEGQFPRWQQLIPDEHETAVTFPTGPMVNALDRLSVVTQRSRISAAKMVLGEGDRIDLSAFDSETGSAEAQVPGSDREGDDLAWAFSPTLLKAGLKFLDCEDVRMEARAGLKPAVFRPAGQPNGPTYLLMPMRTP